jgi:GntR family transcriptional regulator
VSTERLRRDLGASLHHQVFSVLRSGIVSGRYPMGSYLPGEDVLTRDFGVSRATIRRAMQSLELEKLIERKQGRGTLVIYSGVGVLPMSQHMRRFGDPNENSSVDVREFGYVLPPPDVAGDLGVEPGEQVLRTVRLRSAKGVPLRILINHLPRAIGTHFRAEDLIANTMLEALQMYGVACFRVEDEFSAVLADQATAVMLDVRIGAALIESKRLFFDQARRPICHQLTLMPPDRTRFRQVIEADADMPLLRPAVLAPRAPDENGG